MRSFKYHYLGYFLVFCTWGWSSTMGCDGNKKQEKSEAKARAVKGKSAKTGKREVEKPRGDESDNKSTKKVDPNSPTGLAICDEYLKKVCQCAKTHPELKLACEKGKKSSLKWKKSAQKDPSSRKVVAKSCGRALQQIKKSFGCK